MLAEELLRMLDQQTESERPVRVAIPCRVHWQPLPKSESELPRYNLAEDRVGDPDWRILRNRAEFAHVVTDFR